MFSELVEDVPLSAFSKTRIQLVGFGYVQRNSSGKLGEFSGALVGEKRPLPGSEARSDHELKLLASPAV